METEEEVKTEGIKDQLERMRQNKLKNSNQICDSIYGRQYQRIREKYMSVHYP